MILEDFNVATFSHEDQRAKATVDYWNELSTWLVSHMLYDGMLQIILIPAGFQISHHVWQRI